jgi:demethylmenaquinone methyltransferase/2-methoxy-6-polyprenyl-1,4-benzoquinol methylase
MSEDTSFGFKKVKRHLKQGLVNEVFNSVHTKYDLMNDIMSLGMHRLWKSSFVDHIQNFQGKFLDVASGSGDIALKIIQRAQTLNINVDITLSDINESMLNKARDKLLNHGYLQNISYKIANAEELPFQDASFDYYTIAFGLRNCSDFSKVLKEAYRVLKPGGKFLCLEFSQVDNICLKQMYQLYSNKIIPKLGEWITDDREAYKYLVESIALFPNQEALKSLIKDSGFEIAKFQNLTGGIVAIHTGYKI